MLNIGTISHSTLRQQDLLRSFSKAYEQYCAEDGGFRSSLIDTANIFANLLDRRENVSPEVHNQICDIIEDLINGLNNVAIKHNCYFGATEGDGSDFGFWPIDNSLDYVETGTDDD